MHLQNCHRPAKMLTFSRKSMRIELCQLLRLVGITLFPLLVQVDAMAASGFEFRWRFVGGTTLSLQTNAPVLASVVQFPASIALRPLLLTNAAQLWWDLASTGQPVSESALASARKMLPDLLDGLSIGETAVTQDGHREFAIAIPGSPERAIVWENAWSNFFSAVHPGTNKSKVAYQQGWILAVSDEHLLDIRQTRKELAVIPAESGAILRIETASPLPVSTLQTVVTNGFVVTDLNVKTKSSMPTRQHPWEIPGVIRSPLIQFTAARNTQSWLQAMSWFQGLPASAIPSQFFIWSQPSNSPYSGFQTYLSARVDQPAPLLANTERKLQSLLFRTNEHVKLKMEFLQNTNDAGFGIKGFPFVSPRFYPAKDGNRDFVTVGMFTPSISTNPIPQEVLDSMNRSDLVYYDWESTTLNATHWNAISQIVQMANNRMPGRSPGSVWLTTAVANTGFCATEGRISGPNEVSFHRRSPLGLTSAEMSVFASWLDWNFLFQRGSGKSARSPH